jgi:5'-deoxynucleotidase YfbR-like HD superfamily hydrolase
MHLDRLKQQLDELKAQQRRMDREIRENERRLARSWPTAVLSHFRRKLRSAILKLRIAVP